jgi:hypothetical protein
MVWDEKERSKQELKGYLKAILLVFFAFWIGVVVLFATAPRAWGYGEFCDAYYQGFEDGYCLNEQWACYPPLGGYCVELDFRNVDEAYHKGLIDGKKKWESIYAG